MVENAQTWKGFGYLNSPDPNRWDYYLHKILPMQTGWDTQYSTFVEFVKALSQNWVSSIPVILRNLAEKNVTIEDFFKLERNVTFKMAALLHDVNILHREIVNIPTADVSPFISKLSHAFLPTVVYQLEEYGLPRMISKKIHNSGLINFERPELTIHNTIDFFNQVGLRTLRHRVATLDKFDIFVLKYFYQGIEVKRNV